MDSLVMVIQRAFRLAGGFVVVFLLMLIVQHDMNVDSLVLFDKEHHEAVPIGKVVPRSKLADELEQVVQDVEGNDYSVAAAKDTNVKHNEEWYKLRMDALRRINEHVKGQFGQECRFRSDCDMRKEWIRRHRRNKRFAAKLYDKLFQVRALFSLGGISSPSSESNKH